jgi:hypothetical protein
VAGVHPHPLGVTAPRFGPVLRSTRSMNSSPAPQFRAHFFGDRIRAGTAGGPGVLGLVQPALRQPQVDRVRLGHHRSQAVGDQDLEDIAEESPRRLTAGDTAPRVCEYVNHTNMCREYTAVKINAWTLRRRPVSGSVR